MIERLLKTTLADYVKILTVQIERHERPQRAHRLIRGVTAMLTAWAIIVATVSVAGATADRYRSDLEFTAPQAGFGGYNWIGQVKQIGAHWKVPAIYRSSRAGDAATWIGAQDDNGSAFIQLGTLEDQELTGAIEYQAFWSDSAVNYTPQDLGDVHPGDTVYVQLLKKGFGWSLRLSDHARGLSVNRQIDFGFGEPFNQGEWLQENPSSLYNDLPNVPYPSMENVTFQDLTINGVAPRLSLEDGQVLITSSVRYRVPTPVLNDTFSLQLPTSPQLHLLNDMRPSDLEATVFGNEFSHWASMTREQRAADVATFIGALNTSTRSLARQVWPRTSVRAVRKYVSQCEVELRLVKAWSKASSPLTGTAYVRWSVNELVRDYLANGVRESLGLPPAY